MNTIADAIRQALLNNHPVLDDLISGRGCRCGDASCAHFQVGYPWCRPCSEHHRSPECAVDEDGRALAPDGTPWDELL